MASSLPVVSAVQGIIKGGGLSFPGWTDTRVTPNCYYPCFMYTQVQFVKHCLSQSTHFNFLFIILTNHTVCIHLSSRFLFTENAPRGFTVLFVAVMGSL